MTKIMITTGYCLILSSIKGKTCINFLESISCEMQHTYMGGVLLLLIRSSFSFISSLSFGYSSNLLARPEFQKRQRKKYTGMGTGEEKKSGSEDIRRP